MPGSGIAPAVLAGKKAFPKLEEKVEQLESRVKGRLKAGSEMNLLALGKSIKGHIAATASSAGSEVRGQRRGRENGAERGWEGTAELRRLLSGFFPAGFVPQAAAEALHVSPERAAPAAVPAHRGHGKCDAENEGNSKIWKNRKGLGDPTAK